MARARTGAVQNFLDSPEEDHACLLARILHVDLGRVHVQRRWQVRLLSQPVALADAPLKVQTLLRECLHPKRLFMRRCTLYALCVK